MIPASALLAAQGFNPDIGSVNDDVLQRYQRVQRRFGADIPIKSGFRDPQRNARAKGAKKSQHMHGNALDIDVRKMSTRDRLRLMKIASEEGFTGMGVYNNSLHFDTGPRRHWGPSHKKESTPAWAMPFMVDHMRGAYAPQQVAQAGNGWQEVTDPEILRQLQGADNAPPQDWQEVTDPAVLEQLNAPQDSAEVPPVPEGIIEVPLPNGETYFADANAIMERAVLDDPVTQTAGAAGNFLKGIPFAGEYVDELVGYVDEALGGVPGLKTELARALQRQYEKYNPIGAGMNQLAGGILGAAPMVAAGAPAVAQIAPASLPGQVALGLGLGAGGGAIEGGVAGFGEGEGGVENRIESAKDRALGGFLIGGATGAGTPVVAKGAQKLVEAFTPNQAAVAAKQQGVAPQALEITGEMLRNDGPQAAQRLNAPDAMLGDAGPASAGLLDAAIQKAGPGGRIARDAIEARTQRASQNIDDALNTAFGRAGTDALPKGGNPALKKLYDLAYSKPVNYAQDAGLKIVELLPRVPKHILRRADELMNMEGVPTNQRLIQIGDDGEEFVTALPDVRQLDYITRSLNDVAQRGDGKGALGGNTNEGRVYAKLSREIRSALRKSVPEYAQAVNRAANEISLRQARELGEAALATRTSREDLAEAVADMGNAEKRQLMRGVRQYIDDTISNVRRTALDADVESREGLQALRMLSSSAAKEKIETILGRGPTRKLMGKIDEAARAFELRARTAENSKTFARMSMNDAIRDMTEPGALGQLLEGSPGRAAKRVIQRMTAMGPEARRQYEDQIAGDIAKLLTQSDNPRQALIGIVKALDKDASTKALASKVGQAFGQASVSIGLQGNKLLEKPE